MITAFNPGWTNPDIYNQQVKGTEAIIKGVKQAGVKRVLWVAPAAWRSNRAFSRWTLRSFQKTGNRVPRNPRGAESAAALGLVLGKPIGIVLAARLAVLSGMAVKPDAYSWRQLSGAGALAGIGFTMSLFSACVAFPDLMDYAAAKVGIFLTSLLAGGLGIVILWPKESGIDVAADSAVNGDDVKGQ